jgi:MYXO-CTERM domain-containing protein
MDSVLNKIERNDLSVKTPQLEKQGQRIERNTRRIVFAIVFLALLTNAVQLHLGGEMAFAQVLYGGAVLALVGALFSRRRRH